MSQPAESEVESVVLLGLGEGGFELAANQIAELVPPSRVFRFPHRTPEVEGVIVRRGRIVPVCDVGERLIGKSLKSRRLYLIALRRYGAQAEWVALPVTGECELIKAEMSPASSEDLPHVAGRVSPAGAVVEGPHRAPPTPGPFGIGPT